MKKLPEKLKLDFDTTSQVSNITDTVNELISYLEEKEEVTANGICPTGKADMSEEKECKCDKSWVHYENCPFSSKKSPLDTLREEWKKEYYKPEGYIVPPEFIEQNVNHIFDWFSSRTIPIQSLLGTIEEMEGEKWNLEEVDEVHHERLNGYNQGLKFAKSLLTQLIEENKI